MTELPTESSTAGWKRWRGRAAIAVLGAAVLAGAGFLVAAYGNDSGPEPVSAAPGSAASPSASGIVIREAPTLLPSVAPSLAKSNPSASASKPRASTTPQARSKTGFPGPDNTGVPNGTNLSKYTGSCTVTKDRTVVSGKLINCDPFLIKAHDVTIRKSKVNGTLTTDETTSFSFTLEDSEVNAGMWQGPAVQKVNMTIRRSNIHGGSTAVICAANCDIRDSWLHGQLMPDGVDWHLGGFLANDTGSSGRTSVTLDHNTIVCDAPSNSSGGGCSGNINLFPDFGPVSGITVRNNYLGASTDISYCVYGGTEENKEYNSGVRDIVFENNVFERGRNRKCGGYGPVTSFNSKLPGNRWSNNRWEDGALVPPAN